MDRPQASSRETTVAAIQGLHAAIAIASTGFALWAIDELITLVYTPDARVYMQRAQGIINPFLALGGPKPEPLEQARVSVLLPATFVLLFTFWCSLRPFFVAIGAQPRPRISWVARLPAWLLGSLLLLVFAILEYRSEFFYERCLSEIGQPGIYFLAAFPVFLVAYYRLNRKVWDVLGTLGASMFGFALIATVFAGSLSTEAHPPPDFHFNPVVYPIALMRSGVPIGGDVLSLYGFYPTYLGPILALFRPSVSAVCMLFGVLIVATYLVLGSAVRAVIRHSGLFLCCTCAVPWLTWLAARKTILADVYDDPYFQYVPIRMIFPALVLATLAFAVRGHRNQRQLLGLAAFFAVTGLFWNLDSGLACIVSLVGFAFARWPFRWVRDQGSLLFDLRDMGREAVLPMATGALAATLLFVGLFWSQTKSMPPLLQYVATVRTVAETGYSFLPTPPGVGLWHFRAVCLVVCTVLAFPLLWDGRRERLGAFHVAVSLMGMASLVYFFGRSHPFNLFCPSWTIPIALGLILQRLGEMSPRALGFSFGKVVVPLGLAYLAAAPFSWAVNWGYFWDRGRARWDTFKKDEPEKSPIIANAEFMRSHSRPGTGVVLFANNKEGLLFLASGMRPAIPMSSSTDLLFKSETNRIVEFLKTNVDVPVFIASEPPSSSPEIVAALRDFYLPAETGGAGISLMVRKPTAMTMATPSGSQ